VGAPKLEPGAAMGAPELQLGAGRGGIGDGARVTPGRVRVGVGGTDCRGWAQRPGEHWSWSRGQGHELLELGLEPGGAGVVGPGLRGMSAPLELHLLHRGPIGRGVLKKENGSWKNGFTVGDSLRTLD
jgi:hypothetical protein